MLDWMWLWNNKFGFGNFWHYYRKQDLNPKFGFNNFDTRLNARFEFLNSTIFYNRCIQQDAKFKFDFNNFRNLIQCKMKFLNLNSIIFDTLLNAKLISTISLLDVQLYLKFYIDIWYLDLMRDSIFKLNIDDFQHSIECDFLILKLSR